MEASLRQTALTKTHQQKINMSTNGEETGGAAAELIPAGTVVAYAGEVVDKFPTHVIVRPGWLLCNGAAVSRKDFSALFDAIQASHGNGSDAPSESDPRPDFNLPDYRGYFLRGVSSRSGRDPDTESRGENHPGGNRRNLVGSVQLDAIRAHQHPHRHLVPSAESDDGTSNANVVAGDGAGVPHPASTNEVGGLQTASHDADSLRETRPMNAYVHYLIKT